MLNSRAIKALLVFLVVALTSGESFGRVFHSELGRWTRRDPLRYGGSMDLYEYVGTNVLANVDTWGLSPGKYEPCFCDQRGCLCSSIDGGFSGSTDSEDPWGSTSDRPQSCSAKFPPDFPLQRFNPCVRCCEVMCSRTSLQTLGVTGCCYGVVVSCSCQSHIDIQFPLSGCFTKAFSECVRRHEIGHQPRTNCNGVPGISVDANDFTIWDTPTNEPLVCIHARLYREQLSCIYSIDCNTDCLFPLTCEIEKRRAIDIHAQALSIYEQACAFELHRRSASGSSGGPGFGLAIGLN